MPFKSPTQPFCRCCGKPIAKHTRTVELWIPTPHTTRNEVTSEWRRLVRVEARPRTKAECQRYTNQQIMSVRRYLDPEFIGEFGEWDGESYADEFFCKGECARTFGYAMAAATTHATAAYRKAVTDHAAKIASKGTKP